MLPAPAQGAIMIVCRSGDDACLQACNLLNDATTATCAKIERDFLRTLLGGCSTPISALAEIKDDKIYFRGNILSADGREKVSIDKWITPAEENEAGGLLANELLLNGGEKIALAIRNAK